MRQTEFDSPHGPSTLLSIDGTRTLAEEVRSDPLFLDGAARTLQVLSAFHGAPGPLTLSEIATSANIGRSVAQRIVFTLRALGYIERDIGDHGYVLGVRVLDHALDHLRLNQVVEKATPILLELRRNAKERVDLSLFDDTRMVYAVRLQSKRETFFATLVGRSVPIFCTAGGRAVMSHLSPERIEDIIRRSALTPFTSETLTSPAEIQRRVDIARERGYGIVIGEALSGEVAMAAAILGPDRMPLGAVHIAGSLSEWTADQFEKRFSPLVMEAANAINLQMR